MLLLLLWAGSATAATRSFSNNDVIVFPELSNGPSTPYPSTIVVSGLTGILQKVTVTLNRVTHEFPDDLDILLAHPNGSAIYLLSDAGLDNAMSEVTITLDDDASQVIPNSNPIVTGTYRPANHGTLDDSFTPPAPPPPYGDRLSRFQETNPNGTWSLYVWDDLPEDTGFMRGWSLTITTGEPIADVAVEILGPNQPIVENQPFEFQLRAVNLGPATAAGVLLTNTFPLGLDVLAVVSDHGDCVMLDSRNTLCTVAAPLQPQEQALFQFQVLPQVGPTILLTNTAAIGSSTRDLNASNNAAQTVFVIEKAADLALTVEPSAVSAFLGQEVTYRTVLTNRGPNDAVQASIRHQLNPALQLLNAASSIGTCAQSNNNFTCTAQNLGPGAHMEVIWTFRSTALGSFSNYISASSQSFDPILTNNSINAILSVFPSADLMARALSPPVTAATETHVNLSWALTNRGPNVAAQARWHWQPPPGLSFVSGSTPAGECTLEGDTVFCPVGDLAPNTESPLSLTVTASAPGNYPVRLSADSDSQDPVETNQIAEILLTAFQWATPLRQTETVAIDPAGTTTPYPSQLHVSGFTSEVFRIEVALSNLTHELPANLQVLLAAPGGEHSILLAGAGGAASVTNLTLVFDDRSTNLLSATNALVEGVYSPFRTDSPDLAFAPPAPAGPYAADLSRMRGTNPNGTWSLYLQSQPPGVGGQLTGGWSLRLGVLDPLTPFAQFTNIERMSDGTVRLEFLGESGLNYIVQHTEWLDPWTDLGSAQEIGRGRFEFTHASTLPQGFYRVRSD